MHILCAVLQTREGGVLDKNKKVGYMYLIRQVNGNNYWPDARFGQTSILSTFVESCWGMLRRCPINRPQHYENKRNVEKIKRQTLSNMSQHLSTMLRPFDLTLRSVYANQTTKAQGNGTGVHSITLQSKPMWPRQVSIILPKLHSCVIFIKYCLLFKMYLANYFIDEFWKVSYTP